MIPIDGKEIVKKKEDIIKLKIIKQGFGSITSKTHKMCNIQARKRGMKHIYY